MLIRDEHVEAMDMHILLDIGSLSEPGHSDASKSAMLTTF
jgi:hypothetical protein